MYNFSMSLDETKKILSNLSILYIEDEDNIRNNLTATLEIIFNNVFSFSRADEALEEYKRLKPDLILTDIQMEGLNGIDFIKKIRVDNHNIPVILITAHIETEILLEATRLKLIDYLQKPVKFDTLYQAFINAANDIIRQGGLFINFGTNCCYDLKRSILIKNEKEVNLTNSEQKLLKLLLENMGTTLTYERIKAHVWEDIYDATDTALKSLLNKLRGKIGKSSIKNVSGIGYYLVAG